MGSIFRKKQLSIFFVCGFWLGVLYANLSGAGANTAGTFFLPDFLEKFAGAKWQVTGYLLYLLRIRMLPFFLLAGLAYTRRKRLVAALFLCWLGFTGGLLLSAGAIHMGAAGMLVCVVGVLPQMLFYGVAYWVVCRHFWLYPRIRWNRRKTIFVQLILFLGMFTEAYLSPLLLKNFLRFL